MSYKRLMFAVLALLLVHSGLFAQSSQSKSETTLRSIVRKGSATTYFDLFRMILPDLQMDQGNGNSATAHRTIPVRNIGEKEAESLEGNFSIADFGSRWLMSGGRQIALLQLDLSAEGLNEGTPYEGEAMLLAAFTLDPKPKLLDVIETKTDRFTDLWEEQPVFKLNSQNDAVVLHNTHFNAGESYNDLQLLFLNNERFNVITSVFLLNTQGCGATINETPSFRALPDGGNYPKVVVKVKLQKEPDGAECTRRTPGYTRYYQGVFSWNSGRREYQSNSRQLDALDKFNRNRL